MTRHAVAAANLSPFSGGDRRRTKVVVEELPSRVHAGDARRRDARRRLAISTAPHQIRQENVNVVDGHRRTREPHHEAARGCCAD